MQREFAARGAALRSGALGLLTAVGAACTPLHAASVTRDALSLGELDRRVTAAWGGVQRYRTVESIERVDESGQWEPTAPPAATDFVLPDRKYRRPLDQVASPGPEFMVVGGIIYQRLDGTWSIVDPAQIPAGSSIARGLDQLRTAGLDGPPFRLPAAVEGQLSADGSEVLDGRACRWYQGTARGPAGPVRLRVAIEQDRDLPCKTEAEYDAPGGRARSVIRYFDYNSAIRIEPPGAAS
jgi:hypothetical protein